jgi:acyl-CoA thioesterase FadM
MYPFLKLVTVLVRARSHSKLNIEDESIIHFRVGLADIDLFLELNHARYLNIMELGRWDYAYRIGFLRLLRKQKWGITIGGASIRYRRRIPFFRTYTVSTKMICHDGRWLYFLQESHSNGKICASALIKVGITSKDGLVPAPQVATAMGVKDWGEEMPEWVRAWILAEGQRPWPNIEQQAE